MNRRLTNTIRFVILLGCCCIANSQTRNCRQELVDFVERQVKSSFEGEKKRSLIETKRYVPNRMAPYIDTTAVVVDGFQTYMQSKEFDVYSDSKSIVQINKALKKVTILPVSKADRSAMDITKSMITAMDQMDLQRCAYSGDTATVVLVSKSTSIHDDALREVVVKLDTRRSACLWITYVYGEKSRQRTATMTVLTESTAKLAAIELPESSVAAVLDRKGDLRKEYKDYKLFDMRGL